MANRTKTPRSLDASFLQLSPTRMSPLFRRATLSGLPVHFRVIAEPISDRFDGLLGVISMSLHIHTIDISEKGKVATVLYEYQASLSPRSPESDLFNSQEDSQLQRHIETG
jgi:hypothetical protein